MIARTLGALGLSAIVLIGAPGCSNAGPAQAKAAPAPAAPAATPDQAVLDAMHGLAYAKLHVTWDALPKSYQDDLTALVHEYGAEVDQEMYDRWFSIAARLTSLLESKRDILLDTQMVESSTLDIDLAREQWDTFLMPWHTLTNSELANAEALETIDVREFLATTGNQFISELIALDEFSTNGSSGPGAKFTDLKRAKTSLVSMDGDTAVVKIKIPGQPPRETEMVKIEGKWIAAEIANDWDDEMAKAREKIAQTKGESYDELRPLLMGMMDGIESTIDFLEASRSAEEFEAQLMSGAITVWGHSELIREVMKQNEE